MIPWGFNETPGGLVAVTSVQERRERAELGETAILLCTQLGISLDHLITLKGFNAAGEADLVTHLEALRIFDGS